MGRSPISVDYVIPPRPERATGTYNVQSNILQNLTGVDLRVVHTPRVRNIPGTRRFQRSILPRISFRRQTRQEALLHLTSFYEAPLYRHARNRRQILSIFDVIPYIAFHNLDPYVAGQEAETSARMIRRHFECAPEFDRILALSDWTRRDVAKYLGVRKDKIDVVYPGVEPDFVPIKTSREELRGWGLDPQRRYLLYAGAEQPRKNLETLFRAMAHLKKTDPGLRLVKVGQEGWPGGRQQTLRAAREAGTLDRIIFIEHVKRSALVQLYNLVDLMVYPSLYEGFGLPPLEAMACGLPSVTTCCSSLPEVTGDASFSVQNPLDAVELADVIHLALGDQDLRQTKVEAGFAQSSRFTWAASAAATLASYRRVAGFSGKDPSPS